MRWDMFPTDTSRNMQPQYLSCVITCEPLHAVPGRFSQCLSDQALGLVRLIGTDRRVHGLTTDLTVVPVGRVADAILAKGLGQIQIDAGFDPTGTWLVAPVHGGIGLSDMNGNLLWQRDDFGGAIFTPDGRLWAERVSASARPQVHLLDRDDGTTTAWLDLHDPEATDSGWLQATPIPGTVWVCMTDGNGHVNVHQIVASIDGRLMERPSVPKRWIPLAWDATGTNILAVHHPDDHAWGMWSTTDQKFAARRDKLFDVGKASNGDERPGSYGFFTPEGGYAVVDQDMENRWFVADARALDLVDELIITHPPQAPVNEYATATTGIAMPWVSSLLRCGDVLISHQPHFLESPYTTITPIEKLAGAIRA